MGISNELDTNVRRALEALVSDLIEGRLDEPNREQLNFMLRDSQSCRMHFNALMDLQCGLMDLLGQPAAVTSEREAVAVSFASKSRSSPRRPARYKLDKFAIGIAALAAGLLIAFGLLGPTLRPAVRSASESPLQASSAQSNQAQVVSTAPVKELPVKELEGVVRVRQASAAEYFDGGPSVAGQVAELDREYVLNAGLVMLEFPNGAETIVEGPSVFTVVSLDRLLVKQGRCSVHAPEGAEGFRVDTPQTQVVDLGTRFSVDVNEFGRTDVQVVDGAAEVFSTPGQSTQKKLLLREGQAHRFGEDLLEVSQSIQFDSSAYRSNLPDRIVRYECVESDPPVNDLKMVAVQRGGKLLEYLVDDLIGVQIVHYVSDKNVRSVATIANAGPLVRDLLESDRSLATGVINPGGSAVPLTADPVLQSDLTAADLLPTPGIGFRFRQPVVNGPGPDVVLFELHSKVNLPNGDGFHVSPLSFKPGLKSHTVKRYDITLKSVESLPLRTFSLPSFTQNGNLLDFKLSDGVGDSHPTLPFYSTAVGIDLSELGYEIGGLVEGLFLQDDADENRQFDPVFIAGLPSADTTQTGSNANNLNPLNNVTEFDLIGTVPK